MKCQKCGGNNATTHFTQNINGQTTELWLCSDCAEELGIGGMFSGFSGFGTFDPFSAFEQMLGGLFGMPSIGFKAGSKPISAPDKCPLCGSTFSDIVSRGKAGCPMCYEHFADQLAPSIEKLHGTRSHLGKLTGAAPSQGRRAPIVPENSGAGGKNADQIAELRRQLNQAVAAEEYEKAAEIHNQIKKLEA